MERKIKILLSCGGTGGHIFPAIAIADALKRKLPTAEFLFVGALGKMEMEKVPQNGYNIVGIAIAGVQRRMTLSNLMKNLILPFKLLSSFLKTRSIIKNFNPDVAIGTGGYASGPTLKMAHWLGVPTFIQEQNSLPGYTNRILGAKAEGVFVSFDGMEKYFDNPHIYNTGNAIREDFADKMMSRADAAAVLGFSAERKTVFVTGGSLGANAINRAIEAGLPELKSKGYQILWQCGKTYLNEYKKYETADIKIVDFIANMQAAYAIADVIVSRAGGAIFEMFVVGKPLIVLPSPNVAEDHQTKNAEALVESGAAIMVKDADAQSQLVPNIIHLMENEGRQEEMKKQLKLLAKPHAASTIADKIIETLKWK